MSATMRTTLQTVPESLPADHVTNGGTSTPTSVSSAATVAAPTAIVAQQQQQQQQHSTHNSSNSVQSIKESHHHHQHQHQHQHHHQHQHDSTNANIIAPPTSSGGTSSATNNATPATLINSSVGTTAQQHISNNTVTVSSGVHNATGTGLTPSATSGSVSSAANFAGTTNSVSGGGGAGGGGGGGGAGTSIAIATATVPATNHHHTTSVATSGGGGGGGNVPTVNKTVISHSHSNSSAMKQRSSSAKRDAQEEKAEIARLSSFIGAIAIGDLVKSTLGPKGMDKILTYQGRNAGQVEVTNDGATILRAVGVANPAAKILVDMSRVQDQEVVDGTTSVPVLAAELLREAEKLIDQELHPQIIVAGWRLATKVARDALTNASLNNSADSEKFKEDLLNIARTTLSSKILHQHEEHFAKLAVDAVLRLKGSGELHAIQVVKKSGGTLADSFLDKGVVLDKNPGIHQPQRVEKAKILTANTQMDTDKIKIFGSSIKIDSLAKSADLEMAEKEKMRDKVNKTLKHNCNVFINRQLIYNYPEHLFADAGVMAIEHADFDVIERLALVTGGEIVSTFNQPSLVKLGECEVIEQVMIAGDTLMRFSGVKLRKASTVVMSGATQQIIDEAERSLHDALCVITATMKESRIVYRGGSSEALMTNAMMKKAPETAGKETIAMESFAKALLTLPTADNASFDSAQLISELRAAHAQGKFTSGLDFNNGKIADMNELGITESFVVKRFCLQLKLLILRVDHIICCAPRQRVPDRGYC